MDSRKFILGTLAVVVGGILFYYVIMSVRARPAVIERFPSGVRSEGLELQAKEMGAATVAIRPRVIALNAETWDFDVVMNTHSVELRDDMVTVSELILDGGDAQKPLAWEGDAPGGHHRTGVLKFRSRNQLPRRMEFVIEKVGGAGKTRFVWNLSL